MFPQMRCKRTIPITKDMLLSLLRKYGYKIPQGARVDDLVPSKPENMGEPFLEVSWTDYETVESEVEVVNVQNLYEKG